MRFCSAPAEAFSGDIAASGDSLADGRSSTTVNFYLHITRMILGEAEAIGLIQWNPAKVVKVVKIMKGTGRKFLHSLRHSSISAMLDANLPEEIRRKISGHSSSAIG